MISFIVPAYNEEALIGRTIESLNKAANEIGEPFEIVVANDASTDRTAAIAESQGARVVSVNRRHIAATRNEGARESIGDKLIFVDADTVVSHEVVRAAIDAMNKGASGGGSAGRVSRRTCSFASVIGEAPWIMARASPSIG